MSRTCYYCRHYMLCYKRVGLAWFISRTGNTDAEKFQDLYTALAGCCLDFLSGEPWVRQDYEKFDILDINQDVRL